MIDALQVIINGLLVGLVYGLVAVSFVVIYRSSRIVNLAQGEILLLGALFIWTFTLGVKLPWGIGVPIALICCVGMALILERALFRPLIGKSPFTVFMASIALLILLRGVAQLVWGAETRPFPPILPSGAWSIGPFLVTKRLLIGAVLTSGLLVELLHWFFMHTRRACGSPPWRRTTTPPCRLASLSGRRSPSPGSWAPCSAPSARSCSSPIKSCR